MIKYEVMAQRLLMKVLVMLSRQELLQQVLSIFVGPNGPRVQLIREVHP